MFTVEGHTHYVMQLVINPKDGGNTFATASLDKTIKVWQFGSTSVANFTLEGHEKGVYDLT
jgi:coatomer subunit beta'